MSLDNSRNGYDGSLAIATRPGFNQQPVYPPPWMVPQASFGPGALGMLGMSGMPPQFFMPQQHTSIAQQTIHQTTTVDKSTKIDKSTTHIHKTGLSDEDTEKIAAKVAAATAAAAEASKANDYGSKTSGLSDEDAEKIAAKVAASAAKASQTSNGGSKSSGLWDEELVNKIVTGTKKGLKEGLDEFGNKIGSQITDMHDKIGDDIYTVMKPPRPQQYSPPQDPSSRSPMASVRTQLFDSPLKSPVKPKDPARILTDLAFPGSDFPLVAQTMCATSWDFSLLPEIMQHLQKSCPDMDLFVYGDLLSSLKMETIPVLIVLAAPKGEEPLDVAFLKEADRPAKKVSFESVGWKWEQHGDGFRSLILQKSHDVDWEKGQCAKPWTSFPAMFKRTKKTGRLVLPECPIVYYEVVDPDTKVPVLDEFGNHLFIEEACHPSMYKDDEDYEDLLDKWGVKDEEIVRQHVPILKAQMDELFEASRQKQQAFIDWVGKKYPHHEEIKTVAKVLPLNADVDSGSLPDLRYVSTFYGKAEQVLMTVPVTAEKEVANESVADTSAASIRDEKKPGIRDEKEPALSDKSSGQGRKVEGHTNKIGDVDTDVGFVGADQNESGVFCLQLGDSVKFVVNGKEWTLHGGPILQMQKANSKNGKSSACANCKRCGGVQNCPQHKRIYESFLEQRSEQQQLQNDE